MLAVSAMTAAFGGVARADCKIAMIAELPVTMYGRRPMVAVKINGADAKLLVDTGAAFSVVTPGSAAKYKLDLSPAPFGMSIGGVGANTLNISIGTAQHFLLSGADYRDVQFIVTDKGQDSGAGALGENFLKTADVEYDLANGVIRLFRPQGCENADLAYWVGAQQPHSIISMNYADPGGPAITSAAMINGQRIKVVFDTGATGSLLALGAAARAGVKPTDPGVAAWGYAIGATQGGYARTWLAPFASFKIGDEEIKNFKLVIGDIHNDMMLGADFFLAHRVLVSNSQHKIYFTYNGGPVFDMTMPPPKSAAPAQQAEGPAGLAPPPDVMDADAYSRHATALAARRDYDGALADLDHAIQLAPADPRYVLERAMVHRAKQEPRLAMDDFDQALKLKPDYIPALLQRSIAYDARKQPVLARADLDAADKAAAKDPDARLGIAAGYIRANLEPEAIAELDQWIAAHPKDDSLAAALNSRCRLRALRNEALDKAEADCNAALRLLSGDPNLLDSRGLVRLRLGQFDKAIADYSGALKLNPKLAWSLYGRGLAELKKGMKAEGDADIAAAKGVSAAIADEAAKRGLTP